MNLFILCMGYKLFWRRLWKLTRLWLNSKEVRNTMPAVILGQPQNICIICILCKVEMFSHGFLLIAYHTSLFSWMKCLISSSRAKDLGFRWYLDGILDLGKENSHRYATSCLSVLYPCIWSLKWLSIWAIGDLMK